MGRPSAFDLHKLVIGVLSTRPKEHSGLILLLKDRYGEIDYMSDLLDFSYTDYYFDEMGHGIKRFFLSFKTLVDPSSFAAIKLTTNSIESEFLQDGMRMINLDPGLMCLGKFMLASTKDNAQRIPLRAGIYSEITLFYRNKTFVPLPWTYPDYRSKEYRAILEEIRELYKRQLKQETE